MVDQVKDYVLFRGTIPYTDRVTYQPKRNDVIIEAFRNWENNHKEPAKFILNRSHIRLTVDCYEEIDTMSLQYRIIGSMTEKEYVHYQLLY